MNNIWKRAALWVEEQWTRLRVRDARRKLHISRVHRAIERVVDASNPQLRGLMGYRKRLFPVTEHLLRFADGIAAQIPGPARLSSKTWSQDPLLSTLFGAADRVRILLADPDVRAFIRKNPLHDGDIYGVLAAEPATREQLGMELMHGAVRKDVRQTTLAFKDHDLGIVAASEEEVRAGIASYVLEMIVGLAVAKFAQREEQIEGLSQAAKMLKLKRKVITPKVRGGDFMLESSGEHVRQLESLEARIRETEAELSEARKGMETLDDQLDRLIEGLTDPEKELGLETVKIRVDAMNVVHDEHATDVPEIEYVRGRRPDRPGRVLQLIRFDRSEVMDEKDRLGQMDRALGLSG